MPLPPSALAEALVPALAERRDQRLYRQRRAFSGPQQPLRRDEEGRELLSFCSNDYLGLANHPALVDALRQATRELGVGAGAAHLVNGHSTAHHALEQELAEFTGRDRALLFSTGYLANLGTVQALLGRKDQVFQDRLNHASLLDAAQLSRARLHRFAHKDLNRLDQQLTRHASPRRLVAVDGVFSMDGDIAPLDELAQLCERQGAWLMVDDAHGLGVLGDQGRGAARLNQQQLPILMGTLGKAFGVFGAFVAGSEALIETLIQQARSYVYTTALPPALAETARVALHLVREGDHLRQQLNHRITQLRAGAAQLGLPLAESTTAIQPLMAGSAERALDWSARLEARGLLVTAIRPPTVPQGQARLRITLSAAHTADQVELLLSALADLPVTDEAVAR